MSDHDAAMSIFIAWDTTSHWRKCCKHDQLPWQKDYDGWSRSIAGEAAGWTGAVAGAAAAGAACAN